MSLQSFQPFRSLWISRRTYGRIKQELHVKELGIKASYKMSKELGINDMDDFMKLYAVFGGFPKYYVAVEDERLEGKSAEESLKLFSSLPQCH